MNDELVINALKEIRDDQKKIVQELAELKTELAISRNGFTPHEIVELLHWVDDSRKKQERQTEHIKRSVITWGVPILLSALFIGLMTHIK